jgi:hypothetical protein
MMPVSPVMPGSEPIEIVLGKDQPEYNPLPAVYLDTESHPVITRWRFTEEERRAIADGADVILTQLTFNTPFSPIHLQVVAQDAMPVILE